jgi:formiminotetrahydrofolate cyclodeaminase
MMNVTLIVMVSKLATQKKNAHCPSLIKCTVKQVTTTSVELIVMVFELATQKRTYRLNNRKKKPR